MAAAAVPLIIGGAAISTIGSIQQGMAGQAAGNYNAEIARRNATLALSQANADAESLVRESRKSLGSMEANYGASGVTGGSVSDVIADSSARAELDRQNILYKGKLKAMGYSDEASLDQFAGRNAMTQGFLGGASSLLTGAGTAGLASMKLKAAPGTP